MCVCMFVCEGECVSDMVTLEHGPRCLNVAVLLYMGVCVCASACVHVCMCVRACVRMYVCM